MKRKLLLLFCFYVISISSFAQPGALYPPFGTGGLVTSSGQSFSFIGVQGATGKIIVARPGPAGTELLRYNPDGTQDMTWGAPYGYVYFGRFIQGLWFAIDMAVQSDGKIVLLGALNGTNGQTRYIFRLNADGTTDGTFGIGGGYTRVDIYGFSYLYTMSLAPGDKIIATGSYEFNANDETSLMVARWTKDGLPDPDFNGGSGVRIIVNDGNHHMGQICRQDGNGAITVLDVVNFTHNTFRRILSNGSEDVSLGAGGVVTILSNVADMDVDATGKIAYLYGDIHVLNANGTPSIIYTVPDNVSLRGIKWLSNGKFVLAGLKQVSGQYNFWVGRFPDPNFGTNGEVITNFGIPSGISSFVVYNRKIYAGGYVDVPGNPTNNGAIAVYDGSDMRMTCPTPATSYNVDAGKCYATINGINAITSTSTLYANVQNSVTFNGTTTTGEGGVSGQHFQVGRTDITYSYTDLTTQTCSFHFNVVDNDKPVAKAKNITVALDNTGNASITAAQVDDGSTDGCGIQSRSLDISSFSCANVGANTVTLTVTDVNGNSSTATATVTVQDNTLPVARTQNITAYLDASGSVTIAPADVDNGSSDECGSVTLALDKTTFNCSNKGANTVTLTVTDPNNNSSTAMATVTVVDNIAPTISSVSATPNSLWPSDRKMHPVTIDATYFDNCLGTTWQVTGVAIKSGIFANDNINPDFEITGDHTVNLRAEIPRRGEKRVYTVTITATDAAGNTTLSSVDVAVAYNITMPNSGATVLVGSTVSLGGEFWDAPGKKHTAKWLIDDNTNVKASLTEPSGNNNGIVSGSYKFGSAGVYKVQMNVTDQYGITRFANTNENLEAIVVVYDPNGGYTYGGGNFYSPAGALKTNTSLSGDVSYGFTINYYRGATLPKGETEFVFKLGDFEYNALNFDYLAISGARAQFKGTGRIVGGQSGISFIMTVIDGQIDGTGVDKVRMKIFNKNTGQVYYDNQGGSDADNPTTPVGPNSNVVVVNNNATTMAVAPQELGKEEQQAVKLTAIAYPNPFRKEFSLDIKAPASGMAAIEFFTLTGARVYSVKRPLVKGSENLLRFSELNRFGSLVYKITINGESATGLLLKPE